VFECKGQLTQSWKFVNENVTKQKTGKCGLGTYIWNPKENSDRIQEIFNQWFDHTCSSSLV